MIGSSTSVPTRMNAWVLGDAAAFCKVKCPGTIIGHKLMAMPRYDITNRPSEAKNGAYSESLFSEFQTYTTKAKVISGTGDSHRMCGQVNQRSAIAGLASGVHRLTMPMASTVPT